MSLLPAAPSQGSASKPFESVIVSFDRSKRRDSDFLIGLDSSPEDEKIFHAATYNTILHYLRINHPEHHPILKNVQSRRKIRDYFVKNYKAVRSQAQAAQIFGLYPPTFEEAEDFSLSVSQGSEDDRKIQGPPIAIPRWPKLYPNDPTSVALSEALSVLGLATEWVESPTLA